MEENQKQNFENQAHANPATTLAVTILTLILVALVIVLVVQKVMHSQQQKPIETNPPVNSDNGKVVNAGQNTPQPNQNNAGTNSGNSDLNNVSRPPVDEPLSGFAKRASDPQNPEHWYYKPLPRLRKPILIVSKSKLTLSVYDNKKLVKVYDVSVGGNPADKKIEGDKATPEGEFYICVKKGRRQTKFYRSLGLSYPNIEDAKRGLKNKLISRAQYNKISYAIRRRRLPPWNTKLGGAIMIHGLRKGGRNTGETRVKARDTLGCVALENEDILELFKQLKVGTRVIIEK